MLNRGKRQPPDGKTITLAVLSVLLLLIIYVLQRFDFLAFFAQQVHIDVDHVHPYTTFIFNKTLRMCLNDAACVLLIYALFRERKYLQVAFYVFLFELLIVLPIYFSVKLSLEGDTELSSPLLSQIHRMIVNPTLMLLLIVAFFYQRRTLKNQNTD